MGLKRFTDYLTELFTSRPQWNDPFAHEGGRIDPWAELKKTTSVRESTDFLDVLFSNDPPARDRTPKKINRWLVSCPFCKQTWALDKEPHGNELAASFYQHSQTCGVARQKIQSRLSSVFTTHQDAERAAYEVLRLNRADKAKQIVGTYDAGIVCDARCQASHSQQCSCSCGGKNHGKGLVMKLHEEFLKGMQGTFDYTEIFKNPTKSELASVARESSDHQVAGLIADKTVYIWNRDCSEHRRVMMDLHVEDALPFYLWYQSGVAQVMLASFSRPEGSGIYTDQQLVLLCREHPYFKKTFTSVRARY